ncbi:MAG: dTMP kinase [Frankiales bacterium]|jgi:dTMP kinase|nr:dTMP kinase [Frankiales bacterium]
MPAAHDLRGVLQIRAFRRLWIALSFSSFGDWLGLLATTALAAHLSGSFAQQNFAIGGVFFVRFLPALVFGPLAGAFADRFDRRKTMVTCDVIRCLLLVSIAAFHSLPWLFAASFLIETASLFWIPSKEASVPNLVERRRLEAANQLSLITTYGSAPVAAVFFAILAKFNDALASGIHFFTTNPTDLALYLDAATFLVSALTVATLSEISGRRLSADGTAETNIFRAIGEGWHFVASTPLVRGLVIGILGGFAASACVIALARPFSQVLGGGDAGYGLLFGAVFTGLALGMFVGPRLLRDFSRMRLFGLALVCGGIALAILALLPNLVIAVLWTVLVGGFAGIAWVVGYTLLGGEVEDHLRGRTFALVQSLVRVDMLLVIAAAPLISGGIGVRRVDIAGYNLRLDGASVTLFAAGLLGIVVGIVSYRQMDDRDVPLWRDLLASLGRLPAVTDLPRRGTLVVFEGGDGAGKSTQVRLLTDWLRERGMSTVVTREPGATDLGARVRALLLDPTASVSPRSEALLYAADRADHVARIIRPALDRGEVVVSDRYIDSTLAYQGAGRDLPVDDLARISRWATDGLVPDLTVLLDVSPETGLGRSGDAPDRLEAESTEFHERVRHGFRELAERDPNRYLVVDATLAVDVIAGQVRARIEKLLPALTKAAETEELATLPGDPDPATVPMVEPSVRSNPGGGS